MEQLHTYKQAAQEAITALLAEARCEPGDIVVVGCSTSEVAGHKIGTTPGPQIAAALLDGLLPPLREAGLYLAAQCCEHLERSLVVEHVAQRAHGLARLNAIPQPKAGGSFATAAWACLDEPVLVQAVSAAAGLDIGQTLIGMHLRRVVVPVRLPIQSIGAAQLVAARTRLPFAGGQRAVYDPDLL